MAMDKYTRHAIRDHLQTMIHDPAESEFFEVERFFPEFTNFEDTCHMLENGGASAVSYITIFPPWQHACLSLLANKDRSWICFQLGIHVQANTSPEVTPNLMSALSERVEASPLYILLNDLVQQDFTCFIEQAPLLLINHCSVLTPDSSSFREVTQTD